MISLIFLPALLDELGRSLRSIERDSLALSVIQIQIEHHSLRCCFMNMRGMLCCDQFVRSFWLEFLWTFGHLLCRDGGGRFSFFCHVCTTAHIIDSIPSTLRWSPTLSGQAFATLLAKRQHRLQHPPKTACSIAGAPFHVWGYPSMCKPWDSLSTAKTEPEWFTEATAPKVVRRRGRSDEV